jgi:hypothetical protein
MIEKNDPHQEKVKADLSDDDLVIELTDEILVSSDDEDDPIIGQDDLSLDDEDGISEFDIDALDDEDDLTAVDDSRISLIDSFDISSDDEKDVLLLDEEDEDLETSLEEPDEDEDLFDFDRDIELEPKETDEEEYDIFNINDEKIEKTDDHVSLLENLELEFDDDDELIIPETDGEAETGTVDLVNGEISGLEGEGDLPNLIAEMEFAFEEDDEPDNTIALDEIEVVEDGEAIATEALEPSVLNDEAIDRIEKSNNEAIDDDITAIEDILGDDEDFFEPEEEKPSLSEEEEELFDFNDQTDPESEDLIVPLEDIDTDSVEDEEDIIEITEFDQHFPAEDEKALEQAGVLEATEPWDEDDLEFLEVEEIDQEEDEKPLKSAANDEIANFQPIDFISDTVDEESKPDDDIAGPVEGISTPAPEPAAAAENLTAGTDELIFDTNTKEISRQVDKLDAFLNDDAAPEPESASFADESSREDKKPLQKILTPGSEAPAVSPELVTAAVERVISDKFSGKIEKIIYEVIEKVVSKEIERLKGTLLESSNRYDD